VISLDFARKQGFKLRKIERPIYVDKTFNRKRPIKHFKGQYLLPRIQREDRDKYDQRIEVKHNFGNIMAYSLQSGDQLRNRRSEDNKMSGRV